MNDLGVPLPQEDGFSKVKNGYIKSAYYNICDDHDVDADETWMYGDWFYMTGYDIFGHGVKQQRGLHQTILHDGSSHILKVLQERVLKR